MMRGQATPIRHDHQRRAPKNTPTTIMPQRTRLPSYLQTLFHFRSARPSMASSGLGSDVSGNLSITINTWKLPDISSLHNVSRTGIRLTMETMQTYFFSKDNIRQFNTNRMVELSGIEPLTPCLQSRCSPS